MQTWETPYRRGTRRTNPDRRQDDLGPPGGIERRVAERRTLPDRRERRPDAPGTRAAPAWGWRFLRTVCDRVEAAERRLNLNRRTRR